LADERAFTPAPAHAGADALYKTTWTAAVYAVALVLLVMLLAVKHARIAFLQILPMAACALLLSAACAHLLLRRGAGVAWVAGLGALAGGCGATGALALILLVQGRDPAAVFAHPDVQHRLLAGPLLGALFAGGLWQLAHWQARERRAWTGQLQAELERERLSRERLLAELQLLQAQVEPHFLYNTLANLRQLLRTDPPRALDMLEQLIRYFKLALPAFRRERLPLRDELALVECYVALLKERVEQPLQLQMAIDDSLLDREVPSAALLCLVENAVKHGRPEERSRPCEIHIAAQTIDTMLRLTVDDNGPGLRTGSFAAGSAGTGLANLRERLRLLYGDAASLRLSSRAGAGCRATLDLPLVSA
jgi:signal transduction histidine kinase